MHRCRIGAGLTRRKEMTYRISYSDGSVGAIIGGCEAETSLVEEYRTEPEVLGRA
jgi:hypothetical protein